MATFPLPPGHPFTNVRPGFGGFQSTPPGSIINVTTSYIGAVGDYTNNSITLNLYASTGGSWNVTTPAGLTLVTAPTSQAQTSAVYTGGTKGSIYSFNSITFTPNQGSPSSWTGPTPTVQLVIPSITTNIVSGYYDQNYVYITPSNNPSLGGLIPGITDYVIQCTNNTNFSLVDTVGTALVPYPSGFTISPGNTSNLTFQVLCRSNGIIGAQGGNITVGIIQPATPIVSLTSTTTNITLAWSGLTANSITSISTGGVIIATNVSSPYNYAVSSPGTYSFNVISTLCGISTYSALATSALIPIPPSGLSASATGLTVTVTWTNQGTGYSYFVSGTGTSATQTVTGNTATFTGVTPGNQTFSVKSIYGGVTSTTANTVNVSVVTTTPYNLVSSVFGSTVTLTWNEDTPGASFNVSNTFNNTTTNVATTTYSLANITVGTYTFYVTANANGIASGTASVPATITLSPPQNLAVTTLGSNATLTWTEPTAGASFNIFYGITSPYTYVTSPSGTTTYTTPSIVPGNYSFGIQSLLPGGSSSAYSNIAGIVVATPTGFTAVATGSTINLNWAESTTGCSFLVSNTTLGTKNTTTCNAQYTGVNTGSYSFTLNASNTVNFQATQVSSSTVNVLATPVPTATYSQPNITVSWNGITNATSYTITSSPAGLTDPAPSSALSATYVNVPPGTYTFSVYATDGNGDTSATGTASYTVDIPAPTNLTALMTTSSVITLSWTEVLSTVNSFTLNPALANTTINGTARSATITNITNTPASYTFTVSGGYGSLTSPASSSVTVQAFPLFSNSIVATCSYNTATNTYSATSSNTITTDQWSYYPGGGSLNTTLGGSSTVVAKYSGTSIPPGETTSLAGSYFAMNTNTKTGISNTIPSTFPFYVKPAVINSLTSLGSSITVNWTDSQPSTNCTYSVYSSDGTFGSNGIAPGNGTTGITFNNATIGTTYTFTISALQTGSSNFTRYYTNSAGTQVTTENASIPYTIYAVSQTSNVTPIAAPTGVTVNANGTTVTLNWNSVTNANSYNVYRNGTSNNVGTVTTYTYTGTVGTQDTLYVQAVNGSSSNNSTSVLVKPVSTPVITSITQAGAGIFVNYSPPSYGTLSINTPPGLTQSSGTNRYQFFIVSPNTPYSFTLTNTGTNSTSTLTSNFTTINTPTNVTATANGTTSVTVNWSYPASTITPTSYDIFVNGTSNGNAAGTSYTYNQTAGLNTYSNFVVAKDSTHQSVASSVAVATDILTAATVSTPIGTSNYFTINFTYPTGALIYNVPIITGGSQNTFTLTSNANSITILAKGAGGGNDGYVYTGNPGDYVSYIIQGPISIGSIITYWVGTTPPSTSVAISGGLPNGGTSQGGYASSGGGSTYVSINNQVVQAKGGDGVGNGDNAAGIGGGTTQSPNGTGISYGAGSPPGVNGSLSITINYVYTSPPVSISNFKVYDSNNTLYTTIPYSSFTSQSSVTNNYQYITNGLTIGTPYAFYVQTVDSIGDTLNSATTTAVTLISNPTINSIIQTGGSVVVTCASLGGGITLSSLTPNGLTSTSSTSTTFTYSGVTSGTQYTFNVTATGTNATSSSSSNFTSLYTPGTPSLSSSGSSITVSWTYTGSVTGITFTVWNANQTVSYASVTSATTLTFTGTVGTLYTFTIVASSNGSSSIPSSSSSITPLTTPTISSVSATGGTITVNIGSAPAGATITVPNVSSDLTLSSQISSQIIYTGALQNKTYTFSLLATNGTAVSAVSSSVSVTTLYTPGTPTVTVTRNGTIYTYTISFTYGPTGTSVSGITFTAYNGATSLSSVTGSTSITLTNAPTTNFSVSITASNGSVTSSSSSSTSVNINENPSVLQNYSKTTQTTIIATVTSGAGNPTSYSATSDTTGTLSAGSVSGTQITWTGASANTTYNGVKISVNDINFSSIGTFSFVTAFDPTSIGNCALWLDAADSSKITLNGTNITAWGDKSGNNRNTTSIAGGTWSLTGMNGYPGIYYPNNITGPISNTGSSVSVFVVASLDAVGGTYDNMLALNASPITNFYASGTMISCYFGTQNPPIFYGYYGGVGNSSLTFKSSFKTNFIFYTEKYVTSPSFNVFNTTVNVYGNGVQYGPTTFAGKNNFTYTNYYVGQASTLGPIWRGYIGEVLIYNTTLTGTQRQQVEGYLAWKWGLQTSLPAGHPYQTLFI